MINTQHECNTTIAALAETNRLIAKEQRYSVEFQNVNYLAWLDQHRVKLVAMILDYEANR